MSWGQLGSSDPLAATRSSGGGHPPPPPLACVWRTRRWRWPRPGGIRVLACARGPTPARAVMTKFQEELRAAPGGLHNRKSIISHISRVSRNPSPGSVPPAARPSALAPGGAAGAARRGDATATACRAAIGARDAPRRSVGRGGRARGRWRHFDFFGGGRRGRPPDRQGASLGHGEGRWGGRMVVPLAWDSPSPPPAVGRNSREPTRLPAWQALRPAGGRGVAGRRPIDGGADGEAG